MTHKKLIEQFKSKLTLNLQSKIVKINKNYSSGTRYINVLFNCSESREQALFELSKTDFHTCLCEKRYGFGIILN